ncbi:type VI secretion system protein ImpJ [Noviherbaspirillum humi]|uniref:Type VI secretion system protein ImpJ n=1 Tax=Noviherbaspirillum humi TaxID=1688639 RepID=A0A239DJJ0_9BURK|nr:type VI secretion system baseplate subunit TssK [Noviherbaspirillum humi]SNS32606.1 type VI secretion system protein ImpJ [Noviherbaspirillum humi]
MPAYRILWGEGLFLRPQHFQQQEQFLEQRILSLQQALQNHAWGLCQAGFDQDALKSGLLRLESLDIFFRDGTHIRAPSQAELPAPRSLDAVPAAANEVLIHVCLPTLNAAGRNLARRADDEASRYALHEKTFPDLYTDALEAEVGVLQPRLVLRLDSEIRDGYDSVPLTRLRRHASHGWEQDESHVPPLMSTLKSGWIETMLRRLLEILHVKSEALASRHRERAKSVLEFGPADVGSFWLLNAINRSIPLLAHLLRAGAHPERLYLALSQLCGELTTFASDMSAKDIPPYSHDEPGPMFQQLDARLRALLDTVISTRHAMIPLDNVKPSFFIGRLESERMLEGADFYLSIASDTPTPGLTETIPMKFKIGAPDDVEKILHSALPGVRLVHALQTPSSLPVRIGNHYFALLPQGQIFERMLRSRSICVYVPQALPPLKLELIAVFR